MHNHLEGSTVQTNCYKKCSPSNLTNEAGDHIQDDLKEFLANETKTYPNAEFKVENGHIAGSDNNYMWNFGNSNKYDNFNTRKLLLKRESNCTQCSAGKYLKWVNSNNKDDVECGSCHKIEKLRKRETKMTGRIAKKKNLSDILSAEIQAIEDLNDTRRTLIETLQAKGADETKIANVNTRIAKAESRKKRKQKRKNRVDNKHDRISANLVKVQQRIAHLENGAVSPDIC